MGVPAFFRWLSSRYPGIVVECIEEKPKIVNGVEIPVDSSKENPNDVEFDNLYLDMNGIIHPCCHPENKPPPKNEDEMMEAICEYINRIFNIVRPRKLLYMAIDGVAPRAKLNQQRSRRFRASKESIEKKNLISRLREELSKKDVELPPEKPKEEHFDSNSITPGTPFMTRLAECLHRFIYDKLNKDPAWKKISVIFSDGSVPGEGEHKIMDFIRKQQSNVAYEENTSHCFCGADADLILLGLSTHEQDFFIIREEYIPYQDKPCELCYQFGHEMKECTGISKEKQECAAMEKASETDVKFIFIQLNVLRGYLANELHMKNLPFPFNFEKVLDDWIFLITFVGNDFLPHLPSLDIREKAIDRLVRVYKKAMHNTGGYLTDRGNIDLTRVQLIMSELAKEEDEILTKRSIARRKHPKFKAQQKRKKMELISSTESTVESPRKEAYQIRMYGTSADASGDQSSPHERLEILKPEQSDCSLPSTSGSSTTGLKRKREHGDDAEDSEESEPEDNVRLGEYGWKDRYYELKFGVDKNDIKFRHKVASAYCEGLCWVLQYYYQGCPSWTWYYPFHYAPFASDLISIGDVKIDFEKGKPLKPLEQLMAVFPAASKQHLPEPWGKLMCDPESPIIDFYPKDFKIDLNGKRFAWQGVALLPFVDEMRLLEALKPVYTKLTIAEKTRNSLGTPKCYIHEERQGSDLFLSVYEKGSNLKKVKLDNIIMIEEIKSEDPEESVEPVAADDPKVEVKDKPQSPVDF